MRELIYFLLFLVPINILAQSSGSEKSQEPSLTISGIIIGENEEVLPYVAVGLYKNSDSSLVKGSATDENGMFSIVAKSGVYYIQVQFLSYQPKMVSDIKLEKKSIDLGKISLVADNASLDEVVVSTERKAMELRLDKRVYNVDKDPLNKSRNAADILDNLPSVTVDMDGNVSLRGSQNLRILIDGKPSGLVGIRSVDALRNLQGLMIERIEIITNPSARYDAEGEVGIINIVLKKEKRGGVNGSFDARVGYPEDFGGGFSLNYRKGVINLFASYGAGYNKRPGSGKSFQEFTTVDTTYSYDRIREHVRGGFSNNARVGANFYVSKYDVITVSGLYSYSHNDNKANLTYTDYNSAKEKTQVVNRNEDELELEQTIEASLNYKRTFAKKGQEFTFDFQFTDSKDEESSTIEETSSIAGILPIQQRVSNTENEQKWLVQTDYVHPWGKDGKIEAGAKVMLRNIDNDYTVEEQNTTGDWLALAGYDNQFLYSENIYAAYLMAGNKWGKFSAQAGLRVEYSDVTTNLLVTKEVNSRQYFNFFPSAHLSYEFKGENSLQLSYSRRITRPRFWWLLPFFGYSDSRNFFGGNPNLNPEYTHSIELGHLKYFKKGSILSSVYYRNTTGKMDRVVFSDTIGFTRIYPINLAEEHAFGIELAVSYRPWDWWDLSGSANFYHSTIRGEYQGIRYDSDTYAWNCTAKTKWTIKRVFHIQISFNYRSPMIDAQGMTLSRYNFDAGLSLDLFKGKGTLTFSAKDIFNTRKRSSITYGDNFYSESEFQWRSRQFTLNFTYRLNQQKEKKRK